MDVLPLNDARWDDRQPVGVWSSGRCARPSDLFNGSSAIAALNDAARSQLCAPAVGPSAPNVPSRRDDDKCPKVVSRGLSTAMRPARWAMAHRGRNHHVRMRSVTRCRACLRCAKLRAAGDACAVPMRCAQFASCNLVTSRDRWRRRHVACLARNVGRGFALDKRPMASHTAFTSARRMSAHTQQN